MLIYILLVFVTYSLSLSFALSRSGFRHDAQEYPPSPINGGSTTVSNVLIIGGTGGTGRQLLSQALERGYQVTALVRDPKRVNIEHKNLSIVQGDVLDPASVDAAVKGQDAIVSALGHKRFFYPTRNLSKGTTNILNSMDKHDVRKFVCQTSLGIGDSSGKMGVYYTLFTIPLILPFYFWDKTRQERAIAASKTDWVIVRPGLLNNSSGRGKYRHGRAVGNLLSTVRVSRADVATFILDQLDEHQYSRAAPGVAW